MTQDASALDTVLLEIDHCNAKDPNVEAVDGEPHPKELLYGQRMSAWLARLDPAAGPLLQIAVRGQHLERWKIQRKDYPMDRSGYKTWRVDCAKYHAQRLGELMQAAGFEQADIEHVRSVARKENIKTNPDAQTLENCAALVFLDHYFEAFTQDYSDYSDEKMLRIIRRTWSKMSETGHNAALTISFSDAAGAWIQKALNQE